MAKMTLKSGDIPNDDAKLEEGLDSKLKLLYARDWLPNMLSPSLPRHRMRHFVLSGPGG